jgi:hypothetical protein
MVSKFNNYAVKNSVPDCHKAVRPKPDRSGYRPEPNACARISG